MDETIYGHQVDGKTRCVHYCSEVDIVAIKMKCCDKFYACIECHNELEEHAAEVWQKSEFETNAVLCGNCRNEISISEYQSDFSCPNCKHAFNDKCKNHFHLYFEE